MTDTSEGPTLTAAQTKTAEELAGWPAEALHFYAEEVQMPDSSAADEQTIAEWLTVNRPDLAARLAERGVPELPDGSAAADVVTGFGGQTRPLAEPEPAPADKPNAKPVKEPPA